MNTIKVFLYIESTISKAFEFMPMESREFAEKVKKGIERECMTLNCKILEL